MPGSAELCILKALPSGQEFCCFSASASTAVPASKALHLQCARYIAPDLFVNLLIIIQLVLHIRYLALLGCSLGSSIFGLRFISTILSTLSLSSTTLASFCGGSCCSSRSRRRIRIRILISSSGCSFIDFLSIILGFEETLEPLFAVRTKELCQLERNLNYQPISLHSSGRNNSGLRLDDFEVRFACHSLHRVVKQHVVWITLKGSSSVGWGHCNFL